MKELLTTLPAGWKTKPIEELTVLLRRGKSPAYSEDNEGVLVINQDCIRWNKIDLKKAKYHKTPHKQPPRLQLQEGDILLNSTGTGTIGRVNQWQFKNGVAFADSHVTLLRIDETEIDKNYVKHFLSSYAAQSYLEAVCYTGSTNQIELSRRYLSKTNLPYPEAKAEQIAIAAILTKVDDALAATESSIRAAEKLKQALMQNLLTGKLRPDGSWRTEEEFAETKIGMLPKEWQVKTVKEISTLVTDGEHQTPERSESGYYLLSARNIKNGYLDLSDVDYVPEKELLRIQKRCNPQPNDILISCSGTIGNVCIVPDGLNAGMVRSAALVKLNRELIEPEFAELILQSFSLQNQMKVSVASSVQGNIFQGAIKKLRIPYPVTHEERMAIVSKINGFSSFIKQKQVKIATLQRLKKSLKQNLLTGKVRLSPATIDQLLAQPA